MSDGNLIITISREYGSGGLDIGQALADKLGISFWDKKLIERAAAESGIAQDFLEKEGEEVANPLAYLLSFGVGSAGESENMPASDRVFLIESEVIREVADEGSCVIVGRCADYVLGDRPGIVHLFIHADLDSRIARVSSRNNLSPDDAAAEIRRIDKARANHYQHYTDRKWGRAENYDLCISSGKLSDEGVVELIVEYLKILGSI